MKEKDQADTTTAAEMCRLATNQVLLEMGEAGVEEFYWDDAKGGWLDTSLVHEARKPEMQYFRKMEVYEIVKSIGSGSFG